jgi:hypothetical protein
MVLLDYLKYIHIFSGSVTLISGFFAIFSKKGGIIHRFSGKLFFWSMAVTTLLGLNAAIFKPELSFFIPIAIISFYQAASGYRILHIKKLHLGQKTKPIDWILTLTMISTSLYFLLSGISYLQKDLFYAIVLLSFSTIGLYCTSIDLIHYIKKPTHKMYWLFTHIFRMSHGFIAAITAFLVNNSKLLPFLPQVIWLIIPIAIGQPLITFTIWQYKKKLHKAQQINERVLLNTTKNN